MNSRSTTPSGGGMLKAGPDGFANGTRSSMELLQGSQHAPGLEQAIRNGARLAVGSPARLEVRPVLASDRVPLGFFFDAMLRRDYFLRRGQLAEMMDSPRHQVLVAEVDSILVGAAILTRGSRLVNVLVHPAYRGLGIGRALVERSEAREVRVKRNGSNGDAQGFYARLGFRPTGQRNRTGSVELMCRDGEASAGALPPGAPAGDVPPAPVRRAAGPA